MIEKANWTGVGFVFNRTVYRQCNNRAEFRKAGVYILVGPSEESSLPTIYVGEGESVKERLDSHFSGKDFWTWAVFFVSKDDSLNKGHVRYLESQLIELAKTAKQSKLDNEQQQRLPKLSEVDKANTENFLLDMLSIFPLLGLMNVFEKTEGMQKPSNLLYLKPGEIEAIGYEDVRGFVVRKGSQLTKEAASYAPRVATVRKDLREQGVIREGEEYNVFAQDYVFGSPSGAAMVILGRNTNGRTEWKNAEGKTLKQLQTAETGQEEEEEYNS